MKLIDHDRLYDQLATLNDANSHNKPSLDSTHLVFYVQPEHQDAVRWAMRDLLYIPFKFEDGGTRVIHYTPEDYTPKELSLIHIYFREV